MRLEHDEFSAKMDEVRGELQEDFGEKSVLLALEVLRGAAREMDAWGVEMNEQGRVMYCVYRLLSFYDLVVREEEA